MNFEEKMKRLEEIVNVLEKEEIDLDKSILLYEEGLKLSLELKENLVNYENRIKELSENGK